MSEYSSVIVQYGLHITYLKRNASVAIRVEDREDTDRQTLVDAESHAELLLIDHAIVRRDRVAYLMSAGSNQQGRTSTSKSGGANAPASAAARIPQQTWQRAAQAPPEKLHPIVSEREV